MQKKQKTHNEWFQPVSKTKCAGCGSRQQPIIWGEYVTARWHRVGEFCPACINRNFYNLLVDHMEPCGCTFAFNARSGHSLPAWFKLSLAINLLEGGN